MLFPIFTFGCILYAYGILYPTISTIFVTNAIPAICSSLIVAPISYSIDKAIVESSLQSTTFQEEFKKSIVSVNTIVSQTAIMTFLGLSFTLFITNLIEDKLKKILICFCVLTPMALIKDIKLVRPNNVYIGELKKIVYVNFVIRDILSLISALIFPSNINIITHYICLLFLQIPQTYFHQSGIEHSKINNNYNSNIKIKKRKFANNVFFRSIKNLIQYGVGIKINLLILKKVSQVLI